METPNPRDFAIAGCTVHFLRRAQTVGCSVYSRLFLLRSATELDIPWPLGSVRMGALGGRAHGHTTAFIDADICYFYKTMKR